MHIDVLGHPIEPGMTVLTACYWSSSFTVFTKVVKVTKKFIVLEVPHYWKHLENTTVYRKPYQMIVVNQQQKYNKKVYPEHQL